jgi:H/ACA ribonucleoprotein complex non-core subunit NAF1
MPQAVSLLQTASTRSEEHADTPAVTTDQETISAEAIEAAPVAPSEIAALNPSQTADNLPENTQVERADTPAAAETAENQPPTDGIQARADTLAVTTNAETASGVFKAPVEPAETETTLKTATPASSEALGAEKLAAYSDDDIEIGSLSDSSDSPDSDSSDSSSSSDSAGSDADFVDSDAAADDDDDGDTAGPIKSKNEVDEPAPVLPEDYKIPESAPLQLVGRVSALVEKSVIIRANVSGEFRVLKDNSVLCFKDRTLIGPLFETFGRLQSPVYRVKFNTEEQMKRFESRKGEDVYYVVPESQFVLTDTIRSLKGTDASNCHDEELPEEEQEFSDDEREMLARQGKKKKRRAKAAGAGAGDAPGSASDVAKLRKRHHGASSPSAAFPAYNQPPPRPTELSGYGAAQSAPPVAWSQPAAPSASLTASAHAETASLAPQASAHLPQLPQIPPQPQYQPQYPYPQYQYPQALQYLHPTQYQQYPQYSQYPQHFQQPQYPQYQAPYQAPQAYGMANPYFPQGQAGAAGQTSGQSYGQAGQAYSQAYGQNGQAYGLASLAYGQTSQAGLAGQAYAASPYHPTNQPVVGAAATTAPAGGPNHLHQLQQYLANQLQKQPPP